MPRFETTLYRSLLPLCAALDAHVARRALLISPKGLEGGPSQLSALVEAIQSNDSAKARSELASLLVNFSPIDAEVATEQGAEERLWLPTSDEVSFVQLLRDAFRQPLPADPKARAAAFNKRQSLALCALRYLSSLNIVYRHVGLPLPRALVSAPRDTPLFQALLGKQEIDWPAILKLNAASQQGVPADSGLTAAPLSIPSVTAGDVLLAHPLLEPPFERSVVLVLANDQDGTLGVSISSYRDDKTQAKSSSTAVTAAPVETQPSAAAATANPALDPLAELRRLLQGADGVSGSPVGADHVANACLPIRIRLPQPASGGKSSLGRGRKHYRYAASRSTQSEGPSSTALPKRPLSSYMPASGYFGVGSVPRASGRSLSLSSVVPRKPLQYRKVKVEAGPSEASTELWQLHYPSSSSSSGYYRFPRSRVFGHSDLRFVSRLHYEKYLREHDNNSGIDDLVVATAPGTGDVGVDVDNMDSSRVVEDEDELSLFYPEVAAELQRQTNIGPRWSQPPMVFDAGKIAVPLRQHGSPGATSQLPAAASKGLEAVAKAQREALEGLLETFRHKGVEPFTPTANGFESTPAAFKRRLMEAVQATMVGSIGVNKAVSIGLSMHHHLLPTTEANNKQASASGPSLALPASLRRLEQQFLYRTMEWRAARASAGSGSGSTTGSGAGAASSPATEASSASSSSFKIGANNLMAIVIGVPEEEFWVNEDDENNRNNGGLGGSDDDDDDEDDEDQDDLDDDNDNDNDGRYDYDDDDDDPRDRLDPSRRPHIVFSPMFFPPRAPFPFSPSSTHFPRRTPRRPLPGQGQGRKPSSPTRVAAAKGKGSFAAAPGGQFAHLMPPPFSPLPPLPPLRTVFYKIFLDSGMSPEDAKKYVEGMGVGRLSPPELALKPAAPGEPAPPPSMLPPLPRGWNAFSSGSLSSSSPVGAPPAGAFSREGVSAAAEALFRQHMARGRAEAASDMLSVLRSELKKREDMNSALGKEEKTLKGELAELAAREDDEEDDRDDDDEEPSDPRCEVLRRDVLIRLRHRASSLLKEAKAEAAAASAAAAAERRKGLSRASKDADAAAGADRHALGRRRRRHARSRDQPSASEEAPTSQQSQSHSESSVIRGATAAYSRLRKVKQAHGAIREHFDISIEGPFTFNNGNNSDAAGFSASSSSTAVTIEGSSASSPSQVLVSPPRMFLVTVPVMKALTSVADVLTTATTPASTDPIAAGGVGRRHGDVGAPVDESKKHGRKRWPRAATTARKGRQGVRPTESETGTETGHNEAPAVSERRRSVEVREPTASRAVAPSAPSSSSIASKGQKASHGFLSSMGDRLSGLAGALISKVGPAADKLSTMMTPAQQPSAAPATSTTPTAAESNSPSSSSSPSLVELEARLHTYRLLHPQPQAATEPASLKVEYVRGMEFRSPRRVQRLSDVLGDRKGSLFAAFNRDSRDWQERQKAARRAAAAKEKAQGIAASTRILPAPLLPASVRPSNGPLSAGSPALQTVGAGWNRRRIVGYADAEEEDDELEKRIHDDDDINDEGNGVNDGDSNFAFSSPSRLAAVADMAKRLATSLDTNDNDNGKSLSAADGDSSRSSGSGNRLSFTKSAWSPPPLKAASTQAAGPSGNEEPSSVLASDSRSPSRTLQSITGADGVSRPLRMRKRPSSPFTWSDAWVLPPPSATPAPAWLSGGVVPPASGALVVELEAGDGFVCFSIEKEEVTGTAPAFRLVADLYGPVASSSWMAQSTVRQLLRRLLSGLGAVKDDVAREVDSSAKGNCDPQAYESLPPAGPLEEACVHWLHYLSSQSQQPLPSVVGGPVLDFGGILSTNPTLPGCSPLGAGGDNEPSLFVAPLSALPQAVLASSNGNDSHDHHHLLVQGMSRWEPGQLEHELKQGSWLAARPSSAANVLKRAAEEARARGASSPTSSVSRPSLWASLLSSCGPAYGALATQIPARSPLLPPSTAAGTKVSTGSKAVHSVVAADGQAKAEAARQSSLSVGVRHQLAVQEIAAAWRHGSSGSSSGSSNGSNSPAELK